MQHTILNYLLLLLHNCGGFARRVQNHLNFLFTRGTWWKIHQPQPHQFVLIFKNSLQKNWEVTLIQVGHMHIKQLNFWGVCTRYITSPVCRDTTFTKLWHHFLLGFNVKSYTKMHMHDILRDILKPTLNPYSFFMYHRWSLESVQCTYVVVTYFGKSEQTE